MRNKPGCWLWVAILLCVTAARAQAAPVETGLTADELVQAALEVNPQVHARALNGMPRSTESSRITRRPTRFSASRTSIVPMDLARRRSMRSLLTNHSSFRARHCCRLINRNWRPRAPV